MSSNNNEMMSSTNAIMDTEEVSGEDERWPPPPHPCQPKPKSEQESILGGQSFESHELPYDTLLKPLFDAFDLSRPNEIVDLKEVLCCLRVQHPYVEKFFPNRIFIRDCMKTMWRRFQQDGVSYGSNRVLLGSPGVGKSVFFFIAAMYKASVQVDVPVVYVRQTREEPNVSAFVMFRTPGGSLKIFSCRTLDKEGRIPSTIKRVAKCFGWTELVQYTSFLDGPRHDDDKVLNAYYHYFCTSGGHPLPKNAQDDLYLWILDGWTEDAVVAYGKFLNRESECLEAYRVFGGCIRDINKYLYGDEVSRTQKRVALKALVNRVAKDQVDLILTTTSRSNDDDSKNSDRLRMMFNGESESDRLPEEPIQIIDSPFVARLLRDRQTMESYHSALVKGKVIGSGSIVGIYFEELLHQWFKDTLPQGVVSVHQSTGTGREGVMELTSESVYWIPSIPNFANIDAAVVLGGVLYALQYTKSDRHNFNDQSFWDEFCTVVYETVQFQRVYVYIVSMDGISPNMTVNFTRQLKAARGTRSRSKLISIACKSSKVNIVTTTVSTVRSSAAAGFQFDQ